MPAELHDFRPYLAIGAAAVATYALRLGGLLLSSRLPQRGQVRTFMDALPGTLLVSLVAPSILASGPSGLLGAACTAAVAYKTKNVFFAMLVGMAIVGLSRRIMPG